MKHKLSFRAFALAMCVFFMIMCFPVSASADDSANTLSMTEGEVKTEFVPVGTKCTSSDSSVAWVDDQGNLNALKEGTATISDGDTDYTVTVGDYTDGSDVVGNLKILARYNDSMQFYDGHVYLLFTSYQDGVTINVPDLYAGYEVSDEYYKDIRKDISVGSNHTGSDTEKYFTFSGDMKSVTLNRGEIVTIGMYRDFDLTVNQAALGSIQNSTAWSKLKAEGKTAIIKSIFSMIVSGKISTEEATEKLKAVFAEVGVDYNKALDGVVDGGVCFNRELYNQKLEWDQYENVTYDLDITRNQLKLMTAYLGGNLNKFSILKNSCATVALRAWNAAVGTRNGVDTAYKLTSASGGIYAIIDAPKGVRDNIVKRLPGYYLNNAENVAEPDAGFKDDTGWVYVSAPKKVTPVTYTYEGELRFDESMTSIPKLINAAKGDAAVSYAKAEQEIGVKINSSESEGYTAIESVEFTINGGKYTLGSDNCDDVEMWVKIPMERPFENDFHAVDKDGKVIQSYYEDGNLSVCVNSLPTEFKLDDSVIEEDDILDTFIMFGDNVKANTEIYIKNDGQKTVLDKHTELESGTKIYVKSTLDPEELSYVLNDLIINGESFMNEEHFDSEEGAYFTTTPKGYVNLIVDYEEAVVKVKGNSPIQIKSGDTAAIMDYVEAEIENEPAGLSKLGWAVISDDDKILKVTDEGVKAEGEGSAKLWVYTKGNESIGVMLGVEAYKEINDMVKVTFDEQDADKFEIVKVNNDSESAIPYSGYLVKKGTVLKINPTPEKGSVVMSLTANGLVVPAGENITVNADTKLKIKFAKASVNGVPKTVKLEDKASTYQLNAKVEYSELNSLYPVYDSSIIYESSDPLVSVDENGLISVSGDIPEDGASVIVTAYAGSGNKTVFSECKVIVGDYKGAKVVGRLTISARRIHESNLTPHGCVTFTTYNDIDLDASYYEYNMPNDKYHELMIDYENNPQKYNFDPALYSDNELNIEDRVSYFDIDKRGIESEPTTFSLLAGESVSMSNYPFDSSDLATVMKAFEGSTISNSPYAQVFVQQLQKYVEGDEIDGELAFDSFVATLMEVYGYIKATGQNPIDGRGSEGGLAIDREMYNQFRENYSQFPNNYYSVEITADEFANFKAYIANPDNNYYSLFIKNCATGAVDIWNATLSDRPELMLKSNITGVGVDPESLYYELALLRQKSGIDGEGGTNFCPKCVPYTDTVKDVISKINEIGKVEDSKECADKINKALDAYNALNNLQKERIYNYKALKNAKETYDKFGAEAKVKFTAYKVEKALVPASLLNRGDSKECLKLIADATKAIANAKYDSNKTLDENKAAIDDIINNLAKALEEQRQKDAETEPTTEAVEPTTAQPTTAEPATEAVEPTTVEPVTEASTIAPSKVNFSKKPDLKSAVNALKGSKSDADPKGSKFTKLKAKASKSTPHTNKLSWTKIKGAVKYVVMGNKCGKKNPYKRLLTTKNKTYIQKKLKKNTYYKYVVLAVDSNNNVISASKVIHVATKGGKNTNYRSIKLEKSKVTLKKGKTYKIKVTKKTKLQKNGSVKNHRKLRYESANKKIATVTQKGRIKAVKKGTTYVYAYAQNGVFRRIKVTVK